jgi:hypothetical protein
MNPRFFLINVDFLANCSNKELKKLRKDAKELKKINAIWEELEKLKSEQFKAEFSQGDLLWLKKMGIDGK